MQAERLLGRQVPPELVLLAHHQGEAAAIGVFALPGHMAHHAGRAGRGRDHAGEQLERGRLAGAVGPKKGDELPLLDRQIDAANRVDVLVLPAKQPANRGQQPFLLLVNAIGLRESADFDDCHVEIIGPVAGLRKPKAAAGPNGHPADARESESSFPSLRLVVVQPPKQRRTIRL